MMREAYIVAYGRTAIGKAKNGGLAGFHPVDWTARALNAVLAKIPQLVPENIDDLILGCARHENRCNKNMARLVALRAGLPYSVPAQTINRFCSSGLQTVATASYTIAAGAADIIIAGGIEQMSMNLTRADDDDNEWLSGNEPGAYIAMGMTAENVAAKYSISRQEQDEFAVLSHKRAAQAQENGYLKKAIVPIDIGGKLFSQDEGIRADTNITKLAALKPCFKEDGSVTAATSSQASDGASFTVLMSGETCSKLGVKPLARLTGHVVTGCDPLFMGLGPITAVPKLLGKTGSKLNDFDVIELNEAFASQAIACVRVLGLPEERFNPWGGAIALGHPMGATGCVLICKALDYLDLTGGTRALITMCIGGGMGAAGIVERVV